MDVFVAGSAVYGADDPASGGRAAARAGPGGHGALRARGRPAMTAAQPTDAEIAAMRLAGELAARVAGRTSPNPAVGAVVLDPDGRIAGEGATQPAGKEHAEVMALQQAGPRAVGGTLVVTLEPCNHPGAPGRAPRR